MLTVLFFSVKNIFYSMKEKIDEFTKNSLSDLLQTVYYLNLN